MSDVYVCRESAAFEYGGDMVVVHKDVTRVRAGHPILRDHPELFEEIGVHYEWPSGVERATAEPGEKRTITPPKPPETKSESKKPEPDGDVETLQKEAEQLGVKVDKRWGADRLRQEIADASKPKGKA